ncbi:MAG: T9SS type A sorting domain-containing protein [Paludibacter sp.]|nr:T9SS type A sorting domain-containing protein [Paludibacter sp.]
MGVICRPSCVETKLPGCKFLFTVVFFVFYAGFLFATDYYQRQSGLWNSPETWTTDGGWNGVGNAGTYPQSGDNAHIANNGNVVTITLTEDATCANLYFDNTGSASVINLGDFDLVVENSWSVDWGNKSTISQTTGYLQINGTIPMFYVEKEIANFRVGSSSFAFVLNNTTELTVSGVYDYNCFQSSIPSGINTTAATKIHATPCASTLSAVDSMDFGVVCPGLTSDVQFFELSGLGLYDQDIYVTVPDGYTLSTSNDGLYTTTLTFDQNGGNFSQTIFVKFSPDANGLYNGNIVVTGGGAESVNIQVTGAGSYNVVPKVDSLISSAITGTTATLGATVTLTGCSSDVISERGFYVSTIDGFADGAGIRIAEAGNFGLGQYLLPVTDLSPNTTYYFKAYAKNSSGVTYSEQATFSNKPKKYYSRQSGNWTTPSTWTTEGCGGSTNSGSYPTSVDTVIFCQGHTVTVDVLDLSCAGLDMTVYNSHLILNHDFMVNGSLSLTNQSSVSVGSNNLTIIGDFTNTPNEWNSRIEYSDGSIFIGGNITVSKGGYEPFYCSGSGWLIFTGSGKIFTADSNISVPYFKQPNSSFTKGGPGIITISNIFDQNYGPSVPSGVTISIPGNTIHKPTKYYKTKASGIWESSSCWTKSVDGGNSWIDAGSEPDTDGLVEIQSGHSIALNGDVTIENLIVNGMLTINAGKNLTCTSNFTNNGTIKLFSNSIELATILTPEEMRGTGNYIVSQFLNSVRNWYMSSPVYNAPAPAGFTIYKYDEPGNNIDYVSPETEYWELISIGSDLSPAMGFITKQTASSNYIEFTGTKLNNGDLSVTLTRTAGKQKEGYNLLGNPYPSYLDWSEAEKIDVDHTIWYRTKNLAGNYVFDTFNGIGTNNNKLGAVTGMIPPMQSVWVKVTDGSKTGVVNFTNALRTHEVETNRLKMKSVSLDKILRISISNGLNSDETILVIRPDSEYDSDFDALKMSNQNAEIPEIYTVKNNENMVIRNVRISDMQNEIPLGFTTGKQGTFCIEMESSEALKQSFQIFILDKYNNEIEDVTKKKSYSFSSDAVENITDRFALLLKTKDLTTALEKENVRTIKAYLNQSGKICVMSSIADPVDIRVFDVTGKQVATELSVGDITVLDQSLSSGIYFIKAISGKINSTVKIVVP